MTIETNEGFCAVTGPGFQLPYMFFGLEALDAALAFWDLATRYCYSKTPDPNFDLCLALENLVPALKLTVSQDGKSCKVEEAGVSEEAIFTNPDILKAFLHGYQRGMGRGLEIAP